MSSDYRSVGQNDDKRLP